jgi:serine/threonine protein kinase
MEFGEIRAGGAAGMIGRYLLGRRLDDGRTNEVYEATCKGVAGRVVTKFLRRALTAGPEAAEGCRTDLQRLARLRHRNIATLHATGTTGGGIPYLVRERVEGESLRARLQRHGMVPPRQAARVLQGIASALSAAHALGVIHGDLRPSKVFLTDSSQPFGGLVRVVGFGAWRLVSHRQGPGVMAETARFTAPELTRGEAAVDGRADQFSLAALAYLMLTGEHAFPGDDVAAVMRAVLVEQPRPLHEITDVPPEVDAVVQRGLAKQPEHRYGSAVEFSAALGLALGTADRDSGELPLVDSTDPSQISLIREWEPEIGSDLLPIGKLEGSLRWEQEAPPPEVAIRAQRRARRTRPLGLAALLLLTVAVGVASWTGWRPPGWEQHLPWAHAVAAWIR